jgi:hypothetical protein
LQEAKLELQMAEEAATTGDDGIMNACLEAISYAFGKKDTGVRKALEEARQTTKIQAIREMVERELE